MKKTSLTDKEAYEKIILADIKTLRDALRELIKEEKKERKEKKKK